MLGGAAALVGVAGLAAVASLTLERRAGRGWIGTLARATAFKPMFAVRMLLGEADAVASALQTGNLDRARARLSSLVSRPTAELTPMLISAAAIESLAENLGDSVVAPWLYHASCGLPGAAVYRVINTADSMYGYRGEKEWLGKTAAKTDDILSWIPSRLAAAAIVGAAMMRMGKAAALSALMTWHTDGGATESPNAGQPMAAMAGALQRRLEKRGHYVLGSRFPEPAADDIRRAIDLTATAAGIACVTLAGILLVARR